jgi:hypothetical protein
VVHYMLALYHDIEKGHTGICDTKVGSSVYESCSDPL